MYFGSSSYFEDPKVTIDRWPFDKKYLTENVVLAQNKKNKNE